MDAARAGIEQRRQRIHVRALQFAELPVFEYRTPPEIRGGAGKYDVIIVGGGLAGLTAALELGSRGVRTVVFDQDDSAGAAGLSSRGICYAKRSLEILDDPEGARALGRHGKEQVRRKFLTPRYLRDYLRIFNELDL